MSVGKKETVEVTQKELFFFLKEKKKKRDVKPATFKQHGSGQWRGRLCEEQEGKTEKRGERQKQA